MVVAQGTVVRSLAGRDKGKLLVVVAQTPTHLLVCDGKERPVARPKKKNPRHVQQTAQTLNETVYAFNRPLQKALRELQKGRE